MTRPQGFWTCSSSLTSPTARPSRLLITSLWENPFADAGLGKRLLHAAVDHSSREKAAEVHVWTEFDNARAIQLYKSVGFAERALLLELDTSRLDDWATRKE